MKTNAPILLWLLLLASSVLAGPSLLTTLTNPAPAETDQFGFAVTVVGSDQLLVGAPNDDPGTTTNSGSAYLFGSDGTLLMTYTNPTPANYETFGAAVAAIGSDRVAIGTPGDGTGAPYAGAVYLFGTNSTLLTTITNPSPSGYDQFGGSVAALGTDRVIIGAHKDSIGSLQDGAVYLYDTDGMLLTTITNPIPGPYPYDSFGCSVAAVGIDRVLVGAYQDEPEGAAEDAGVAHLFDITTGSYGTLLTTFTNPAPAFRDYFGWSVAAVGADRVLIGAYKDDGGAVDAGEAYLFSTDGTLLTTITNPVPESLDLFGTSVASVGSDRLLIGAPNARSGSGFFYGAAYLFSTDGTLLNTLTNPAPAHADSFGWSVAAAGTDWALIGAYRDDAGATDAGAAYLFSLENLATGPQLVIISTNAGEVSISWVPDTPGFVLQEQSNLASNEWINSSPEATNSAVIPAALPARFYRLIKP